MWRWVFRSIFFCNCKRGLLSILIELYAMAELCQIGLKIQKLINYSWVVSLEYTFYREQWSCYNIKYSSGPSFIASKRQIWWKSNVWAVMVLWDNEQIFHTSLCSKTWSLDALWFLTYLTRWVFYVECVFRLFKINYLTRSNDLVLTVPHTIFLSNFL